MTKKCNKCERWKGTEEFAKTPKGDPAGSCKECRKAYYKKYYEENPGRKKLIIEHNRNTVEQNIRRMVEYLVSHPCVDCGESDPIVLEFDHVKGDKIASVSKLVHRPTLWSKVEEEIAKCVVRCANCHRRHTAKRNGEWYKAYYQH